MVMHLLASDINNHYNFNQILLCMSQLICNAYYYYLCVILFSNFPTVSSLTFHDSVARGPVALFSKPATAAMIVLAAGAIVYIRV